ncbi:MAG: prephenate dehydratase [Rhodospirillales bacterium]|nr:prephenate dehydratase [Rhodospirillales bacterium]
MDRPLQIAFQGELGAHSHMACLDVFPDSEVVPCPAFEDCFQEVHGGRADRAVIPVDNSAAGRVADIHRLLPASGLHIIGEHFASISHHLMAPAGTTLGGIRQAASHFHALSQCRKFLQANGIEPFLFEDTAGAARHIAEGDSRAQAAIASELAAELYGLEIVARAIEDDPGNTTRFLVLGLESIEPEANCQHTITSLVFRVRNIPAALYKALGGFATNRVNMLKLESFMADGSFASAEFYADIEGHPEHPNVALALEELGFFSRSVRVLGVYPASKFRRDEPA